MELKDFISETLSQLLEGIIEAQNKSAQIGGRIVPYIRPSERQNEITVKTRDHMPIIFVDFDVSIVAGEDKGSKATIGVVAGLFGGGVQGHSSENLQTANKIKFKIPVALPLHKENDAIS